MTHYRYKPTIYYWGQDGYQQKYVINVSEHVIKEELRSELTKMKVGPIIESDAYKTSPEIVSFNPITIDIIAELYNCMTVKHQILTSGFNYFVKYIWNRIKNSIRGFLCIYVNHFVTF